MSSQRMSIVTFYHDIEQDFDSSADPAICRDVVRSFLELEERYGAHATYNIVGRLFTEQPDLVESIRAGGHEAAFHSHHHHRDWRPKYYADEVALCRAASSVPTGYRSPRSQWGRETLAALWDNGFLWSAENEPDTTEPYFVHQGLVRLPILTDDWQVFKGRQTFDEWVQQFAKAVDSRPYVAIGLHDCVAATDPAVWLSAYERLLRTASERNALLLTFAETADLFRRGAVARNVAAVDASSGRRATYRSKRCQELLREASPKIEQPVIAELAARDAFRAANVADRSVDLIVCGEGIEYAYSSDDVAEEIKRIAKPGAICVAAFPAAEGPSPRLVKSPADRMRRPFSRDDVLRFSGRLGRGRVVGVQYDSAEPVSAEDERRYRQAELAPPASAAPTLWVSIVEIEASAAVAVRPRAVPLELCPFEFQPTRFRGVRSVLRSAKTRLPQPLVRTARVLLGKAVRTPH